MKSLKALLVPLFLTLALIQAGSALAQDSAAERVVFGPAWQQLQQLLEGFDTFQADVRQIIVEADGGVLEESDIRFLLKRPDGFYWETLEPWPELIVTDGESLWHYEPDLWQLTIDDWDAAESALAARLLGGQTEALTEEYDVARHDASSARQQEFVLVPHDPVSTYVQLSLYFEDSVLASIQIAHSNGQQTVWQFRNARVDEKIDDRHFQFDMPDDEDLEVIDNRSQAS